MKLRKAQQKILLTWIAEGLETDEINQRASRFRPRFKVSWQQVDYYRKSRDLQLEEIKEASEATALKTGFALREIRVARLNELAEKIYKELTEEPEKWWLPQVKGIGSRENYERIDYYEFNREELESFRGVLDDIAAEVGDRKKAVDVTSGGEKIEPKAIDNERFDRAISTLADAIRDSVSGTGAKQGGEMDPAK